MIPMADEPLGALKLMLWALLLIVIPVAENLDRGG